MNDIEKNTIHPSHYNKANRRECWDEMEDIFGKVFVASFCIGSAYKYLYRKGEKESNPEEQDVAKIKVYMNKAKDILKSAGRTLDNIDAHVSYRKIEDILKKEGINIE